MWTKSENSEPIVPLAVEYSGDQVILRKGFQLVEATEEKPSHYEYDEWQMPKEQYDIYQNFETLSDALTETNTQVVNHSEALDDVYDALAELAEMIVEG